MTIEAKDGQAQEFLSGKLEEVDVVGIERELRSLWDSAVSASSQEGKNNVVRACALNFVLYTTNPNDETSMSDLLSDIAMSHPCRALLAVSAQSETPSIEAWVTARCHLDAETKSKQICCEQITVRSEGPGRHKLSSAILPLLLPDLPVVLWWHAPTLEKLDLDPFIAASDKLLVDTQTLNDNQNIFAQICELASAPAKGFLIADLNWGRLIAWRKLFATLFGESAFLSLNDIKQIKSVKITYSTAQGNTNNGSSGTSQSLIFLSWLTSRLNWHANAASGIPGDKLSFQFNNSEAQIETTIEGTPADMVPFGNLVSVRVTLSDNRAVEIRFEPNQASSHLSVSYENGGQKEKHATVFSPSFNTTDLIGQELEQLEYDSVLGQSLAHASALIHLLSMR